MNSIKVFWHGKPLREVYPHANKWQMFKFWFRKLARKTVILSVIVGSLTLSSLITKFVVAHSPETVYKAEANDIQTYLPAKLDNSLNKKIEELKLDVVGKIKACESAGHKEDDGIIIFDTNNKASIGSLQFQKATVIYYYKSLYQKDITAKDAVLIALDDTKAEALAYDVIFETAGNKGLANWLNCANKYNLREQVNIINKLSN